MAESAVLMARATGGNVAIGDKTYSGDDRIGQSFTVGDSVTDQERTLEIDVSELEFIFIISDQDILLEWNDNVGTQGILNLKANVPFIERKSADQYHTSKFGAVDVSTTFWTNTSGATATITINGIQNNTP